LVCHTLLDDKQYAALSLKNFIFHEMLSSRPFQEENAGGGKFFLTAFHGHRITYLLPFFHSF